MNKKLGGVVAKVEQLGKIVANIDDEQKVTRNRSYERFKPMKG
jgi:hypothetical protein